MPFKSVAQRRFMYAKHPEIAKKWSKEYPNQGKLPEKVSKEQVVEGNRLYTPDAIPRGENEVTRAHLAYSSRPIARNIANHHIHQSPYLEPVPDTGMVRDEPEGGTAYTVRRVRRNYDTRKGDQLAQHYLSSRVNQAIPNAPKEARSDWIRENPPEHLPPEEVERLASSVEKGNFGEAQISEGPELDRWYGQHLSAQKQANLDVAKNQIKHRLSDAEFRQEHPRATDTIPYAQRIPPQKPESLKRLETQPGGGTNTPPVTKYPQLQQQSRNWKSIGKKAGIGGVLALDGAALGYGAYHLIAHRKGKSEVPTHESVVEANSPYEKARKEESLIPKTSYIALQKVHAKDIDNDIDAALVNKEEYRQAQHYSDSASTPLDERGWRRLGSSKTGADASGPEHRIAFGEAKREKGYDEGARLRLKPTVKEIKKYPNRFNYMHAKGSSDQHALPRLPYSSEDLPILPISTNSKGKRIWHETATGEDVQDMMTIDPNEAIQRLIRFGVGEDEARSIVASLAVPDSGDAMEGDFFIPPSIRYDQGREDTRYQIDNGMIPQEIWLATHPNDQSVRGLPLYAKVRNPRGNPIHALPGVHNQGINLHASRQRVQAHLDELHPGLDADNKAHVLIASDKYEEMNRPTVAERLRKHGETLEANLKGVIEGEFYIPARSQNYIRDQTARSQPHYGPLRLNGISLYHGNVGKVRGQPVFTEVRNPSRYNQPHRSRADTPNPHTTPVHRAVNYLKERHGITIDPSDRADTLIASDFLKEKASHLPHGRVLAQHAGLPEGIQDTYEITAPSLAARIKGVLIPSAARARRELSAPVLSNLRAHGRTGTESPFAYRGGKAVAVQNAASNADLARKQGQLAVAPTSQRFSRQSASQRGVAVGHGGPLSNATALREKPQSLNYAAVVNPTRASAGETKLSPPPVVANATLPGGKRVATEAKEPQGQIPPIDPERGDEAVLRPKILLGDKRRDEKLYHLAQRHSKKATKPGGRYLSLSHGQAFGESQEAAPSDLSTSRFDKRRYLKTNEDLQDGTTLPPGEERAAIGMARSAEEDPTGYSTAFEQIVKKLRLEGHEESSSKMLAADYLQQQGMRHAGTMEGIWSGIKGAFKKVPQGLANAAKHEPDALERYFMSRAEHEATHGPSVGSAIAAEISTQLAQPIGDIIGTQIGNLIAKPTEEEIRDLLDRKTKESQESRIGDAGRAFWSGTKKVGKAVGGHINRNKKYYIPPAVGVAGAATVAAAHTITNAAHQRKMAQMVADGEIQPKRGPGRPRKNPLPDEFQPSTEGIKDKAKDAAAKAWRGIKWAATQRGALPGILEACTCQSSSQNKIPRLSLREEGDDNDTVTDRIEKVANHPVAQIGTTIAGSFIPVVGGIPDAAKAVNDVHHGNFGSAAAHTGAAVLGGIPGGSLLKQVASGVGQYVLSSAGDSNRPSQPSTEAIMPDHPRQQRREHKIYNQAAKNPHEPHKLLFATEANMKKNVSEGPRLGTIGGALKTAFGATKNAVGATKGGLKTAYGATKGAVMNPVKATQGLGRSIQGIGGAIQRNPKAALGTAAAVGAGALGTGAGLLLGGRREQNEEEAIREDDTDMPQGQEMPKDEGITIDPDMVAKKLMDQGYSEEDAHKILGCIVGDQSPGMDAADGEDEEFDDVDQDEQGMDRGDEPKESDLGIARKKEPHVAESLRESLLESQIPTYVVPSSSKHVVQQVPAYVQNIGDAMRAHWMNGGV